MSTVEERKEVFERVSVVMYDRYLSALVNGADVTLRTVVSQMQETIHSYYSMRLAELREVRSEIDGGWSYSSNPALERYALETEKELEDIGSRLHDLALLEFE